MNLLTRVFNLASGIALALTVLSASSARAATVLLTVDIANPSAIVIASTGAKPITSSTDIDLFTGVTLVNVFSTAPSTGYGGPMSGTLSDAGGHAFDEAAKLTTTDLNLFGSPFGGTETFSPSAAAFTGSSVLKISLQTYEPVGTIGDIRIGDGRNANLGPVIGQFQLINTSVVPTPAAAAGGLVLLGGLVTGRRRRQP